MNVTFEFEGRLANTEMDFTVRDPFSERVVSDVEIARTGEHGMAKIRVTLRRATDEHDTGAVVLRDERKPRLSLGGAGIMGIR